MDAIELFVAICITIAVNWIPFIRRMAGTKTTDFYKVNWARVPLAPPMWVFPIAWFILYGLITAAGILYALSVPMIGFEVSAIYKTIIATYFVNVTLNHYWVTVFFHQRNVLGALCIAFLLFATSLVVVIFFAIENMWLEFGLYMPYVVWLFYAMILNASWLLFGRGTKHKTKRPDDSHNPQQFYVINK